MGQKDSSREFRDTSDEELVRLAAGQGSAEAFEELMSRYYERTYAVIYRMVNNEERARDLTQETFLKAWRGLGQFAGQAGFFTWIYRIASNVVKSDYRKLSVRPQVATSLSDPEGGAGRSLAEDAPGPASSFAAREKHQVILDAIEGLSPDFREMIVLRDLEELSYDDIAEMLELPVGTVRSRLHRARLELRSRLSAYFESGHHD